MLNEGGCACTPKKSAAARTHTRRPTGWLTALVALVSALMLTGCSNVVKWREEVRLSDGRTIVVTQKRRCEGGDYGAKRNATCVAREAWLTVQLPEFSTKDIIWHESLNPMVLNVHKGQLYIVGYPTHPNEFRVYGGTNPPYFGFRWHSGQWERIPFDQIPVEIYGGNLLIESIPKTRTSFLPLERKNSSAENGDSRYEQHLRRIDPKFAKALL